MNILYLFQDEYPWDVRVEKITSSLARHHEVHILCRNRGNLLAIEQIGPILVHRIGGGAFGAIRGFPAFFSPWWIAKGLRLIRSHKIGLIIVRDLPLCALGLLLRYRTGIPIVFDMAEDYPAMIADTWRHRGPGIQDYLLRNPRFLRSLESYVLPRVTETWVVSSASRNRISTIARGPIRVIGNTPTRDILATEPGPQAQEDISIVYAGFVDETRGLGPVIRAIGLARAENLPFTLRIIGSGSAIEQLKLLVQRLNLAEFVKFYGWRSQADLRSIIASSSVGIVPHRVTDHTNTTLPNKIFDYMALARPVIVSDARALRDVIEQFRCGVVFRDADSASLLSCLRELLNPDVRRQLGAAGRKAVEEHLNWAQDEKMLLESVAQIADQSGLFH